MANVDNYVSEVYEKRKKRRFYFFLAIVLGLIYGVALGASWLVLRSPLFHIQKITITGNEAVVTSDILSLLQSRILRSEPLKALLGFNNILIWPDGLSSGDLIFLPALKSLKIEKNYRERSVIVAVEERKPYGIWCYKAQTDADFTQNDAENNRSHPSASSLRESASRCWWFDDEGIIFKRAIAAQGSLIVAVNDYSQTGHGLNSKILPGDFVSNAFSIFRVLQAGNLNLKEIRLRDLSREELEVATHSSTPLPSTQLGAGGSGAGPIIYFSLRFPADNALVVIENFLAKPGFDKLQYLDFRVENRVYYK